MVGGLEDEDRIVSQEGLIPPEKVDPEPLDNTMPMDALIVESDPIACGDLSPAADADIAGPFFGPCCVVFLIDRRLLILSCVKHGSFSLVADSLCRIVDAGCGCAEVPEEVLRHCFFGNALLLVQCCWCDFRLLEVLLAVGGVVVHRMLLAVACAFTILLSLTVCVDYGAATYQFLHCCAPWLKSDLYCAAILSPASRDAEATGDAVSPLLNGGCRCEFGLMVLLEMPKCVQYCGWLQYRPWSCYCLATC
ncbi:hypothetical protein Nepgr_014795 [Nepenthes gracilis]|uniref:Uncharacterized protein n=1 Tax=Nepenthes gracilis TaxID=150966 RepID=A0AAD3SLH7_NEPGR|nr:hypothetical protein Nepgr_014795 [Nepenthes gracilis]